MKETKNVEIDETKEVTEMKASKFAKVGDKLKSLNVKKIAKGAGIAALVAIISVIDYKLVNVLANHDSKMDDDFEEFVDDEEAPEE